MTLRRAIAEALHAEWEPEEPLCDGRCYADADVALEAIQLQIPELANEAAEILIAALPIDDSLVARAVAKTVLKTVLGETE